MEHDDDPAEKAEQAGPAEQAEKAEQAEQAGQSEQPGQSEQAGQTEQPGQAEPHEQSGQTGAGGGAAGRADRHEKERRRRRRAQERRRKRRKDEDREDAVPDALDAADSAVELGSGCSRLPGCGRGRGGRTDADGCGTGGGSGGSRGGGGCDGCDGPCNLTLLRLSTMLLVAAAVVPERPAGKHLVRALVRGYQRWLTRFTPSCPSTPNCSAYAIAAVDSLGARRGLVAAAERIRSCGTG